MKEVLRLQQQTHQWVTAPAEPATGPHTQGTAGDKSLQSKAITKQKILQSF